METAGQRGPIRAHAFQSLEYHLSAAISAAHHAGVAFFASGLFTTHRRHEKAQVQGLKFEVEEGFESILARQMRPPPIVQGVRELRADGHRFALVDTVAKQYKQRIGVTVNDPVALFLDAVTAGLDNLVAAPGDAAGEAGIVETATRRAEHTIEGIHENFHRLGERGIIVLLGFVPRTPQLLDELRENGAAARELCV